MKLNKNDFKLINNKNKNGLHKRANRKIYRNIK